MEITCSGEWTEPVWDSSTSAYVLKYNKVLESGATSDSANIGIKITDAIQKKYNITNNDGNINVQKKHIKSSFEISIWAKATQAVDIEEPEPELEPES